VRIKDILIHFVCSAAIIFTGSAMAQSPLPPKQWSLNYGGNDVDIPFVIKFTSDGGTIAAGYTDSKSGDVSPQPSRDYWDLWIVKLDRCGTIQWERSFGGTGYESARDIAQTADGGYIVLGETNSTDGGVVAGFGGTKDIWLLKITAAGTLQWQKRYGGSGLDIGNHLEITSDGGYLIAASSSSNDGDIRGNHGTGGYTDGVLMKLTSAGVVQWSKCYGGSKNEELFDFEIINGITYLAGFTNSVDGDIPPDQKNYDVWLLAVDANGNKMFSKIYGGSQNDVAYCMTKGADGSLTLAGYTTSTDGDVAGAKGSQDFWIINVDTKGQLIWQKDMGGSDAEYARTIITDKDSCYIIGGISYSADGDITNPLGEGDYWTVKLSPKGNVIWKRNWGGRDNDHLRSLIVNPLTNEYYLAGDSESDDGDFNLKGETDFGIIKLKLPELLAKDSAVCIVNGTLPQDTLRDICGYDSAIVNYTPVLINGPFNNIRKADSIFAGQSVVLHTNGNGTIIWNTHSSLNCTACPEPVATPTATTTYTATNSLANGCQVSDQFTVVVLTDAVVMVPNAFTPNGDGLNDYFGPIGKVPEGYRMQLFNRNGEVVFKSSAIDQRWNGIFKGRLQPTSVFVYLIDYKDLQNKPHQQKGTFMLIR